MDQENDSRPEDLTDDVRELKRRAKFSTWVVRTIAGSAMVTILWLIHGIWDRSAMEERSRMEIEVLKIKVEEIRMYLRNQGMKP